MSGGQDGGMGRATDRRGVLRIDLDELAEGRAPVRRPDSLAGRNRWRSGWRGRAGRRRRSPSPCVRRVTIWTWRSVLLTEGMIRPPTTCSPRSSARVPRRQHIQRGGRDAGTRRPRADHRRGPQLLHNEFVRSVRQGSIDAVRTRSLFTVTDDPLRVPATVLADLPERLRAAQRGFDRTGGLHAAGCSPPTASCGGAGRRRPAQRGGQGIGWAVRERRLPLADTSCW